MATKYDFGRSLTGPKLQEDGTDLDRFPILNIGNGLTVESEPSYPRHTIQVAFDGPLPVNFTASVGSVTMYNAALPRFANTGLISSGSIASITCSLNQNCHFNWSAIAYIRNVSSASVWSKSIFGQVTYVSGSTAVIDYQDTNDAYFPPTSASLSASIVSNQLVIVLTSATGSNYGFTIVGDGSTVLF